MLFCKISYSRSHYFLYGIHIDNELVFEGTRRGAQGYERVPYTDPPEFFYIGPKKT